MKILKIIDYNNHDQIYSNLAPKSLEISPNSIPFLMSLYSASGMVISSASAYSSGTPTNALNPLKAVLPFHEG